jgi:transcriptional/translational regulatory protein YebC/TACO1
MKKEKIRMVPVFTMSSFSKLTGQEIVSLLRIENHNPPANGTLKASVEAAKTKK